VEFSYTPEQEILRETIRDFALNEIAPHSLEWDEKQHFPLDVIQKLGELGMMGAVVDPQYGGAGLGYPEYVVVVEELARVDGSIALSVAAHNSLCANHISLLGSEEQKKKYLTPLANGKSLGAWALTEPGSGSDAASAQTRATRKGGCWVLNGAKSFCTHGSFADTYVILAVTDRSKGKHGISSFIVEKGTPGLTPGKKENKLGCRSSDTASLALEECCVPDENLLGEEGEGFIDALGAAMNVVCRAAGDGVA